MELRTRRSHAILLAVAAALLAAPAANAADRYASPTGTGPAASCPQANPCNIQAATEDASVVNGDRIVVLPGTYSIGANAVEPFDNITVEGQQGQPRPRILGTNNWTVFLSPGFSVTLRRLYIESANFATGYSLYAEGQHTIEQSHISASGTTATGVVLRNGTLLTDSVVSTPVDFTQAVFVGGTPAPGLQVRVRNSTLIGGSPAGIGLAANANGGANSNVLVRNTIARGGTTGIEVADDGGTDNVILNAAFSNYSSVSDDASAEAVFVDGGGNQTAAPLFAAPAAGDFRQRPGSATIGAGSAVGGLGSLDFDGQPRTMGSAPDIGADEAVDPASLVALEGGKLKRKRTLRVTARCPASACNVALAANLVLKGTPTAARAAKVVKLKNGTASLLAGQSGAVVLRLKKAVLAQLRGARKATLKVAASATDPVGFSGTASASLRFKKR